MKVRIKKLIEEAVVPVRAHKSDAGMDLTATHKEVTSKFIEYGTGLSMEIPEGHMGLIFPRSSISKTNLTLCNSVGIVDSSYRGEIKIRFDRRDHDASSISYKLGDRVAQIIIMPYPEVEFDVVSELDETIRGSGGFGSSDNKIKPLKEISTRKLVEL